MPKLKLLAIITVLILLVMLCTVSYAETSGEKLYKYGLISGNNGEIFEDEPLNRAQMCVLLAELYGRKDVAAAYKGENLYKDIKTGQWYAPFVNYAKTQGWIYGYNDGNFGPLDPVTYPQLCAFVLNALNYPYKWNEVTDVAGKLGIKVTVENPDRIKRAEAFEGIWKALFVPRYQESEYFGVTLNKLPYELFHPNSGNNESNSEKDSIEVVETKLNGLNEIEIRFNKPVKSTVYIAPEQIKLTQLLNDYLKASKVVVTSDDLGIIIYTNTPLYQGKELAIELKNIHYADGALLKTKIIEDILVSDTLPVEVKSIEQIGPNYLKIEFNKPVVSDNADGGLQAYNILVDAGANPVTDIRLYANNKTAIVEVKNLLASFFYAVPRTTIRSYAGLSVEYKPEPVMFTRNTTPPMVTGYQIVNPNKIILYWNKYITSNYTMRTDRVYHTNTVWTSDFVFINGREMVIDFRSSPLNTGKVQLYLEKGIIKDYFGIVNDKIIIDLEIDMF